jgi:hypothetical protein
VETLPKAGVRFDEFEVLAKSDNAINIAGRMRGVVGLQSSTSRVLRSLRRRVPSAGVTIATVEYMSRVITQQQKFMMNACRCHRDAATMGSARK